MGMDETKLSRFDRLAGIAGRMVADTVTDALRKGIDPEAHVSAMLDEVERTWPPIGQAIRGLVEASPEVQAVFRASL